MLHFRYLCPKMPLSQVPAWIYQPRRDKYNKNIKKYHVDVDSDEEDENIDEEREKEEEALNTTNVSCFKCFSNLLFKQYQLKLMDSLSPLQLLYPDATFLPIPLTLSVSARTEVRDFRSFKKTKPKKPAAAKSSDSESDTKKANEAVGPKQDRGKRFAYT